MPPAWKIDAVNGDQFTGGGAGILAAVAGYPHLTVPMGLVKGLPVGLSFIGPKWSEALLLNLGYAYEQARGPFPTPEILSLDRGKPGGRSVPPAPALEPRHQDVRRSAAIAATIARISRMRAVLDGSWNQRMPTTTVPTAPMPPQTA